MSEIATLHNPFRTWLSRERIPFIWARADRESTIAPGHPDFTLLLQARSLLIEFKAKDGKLDPAQKERIAELEATGTPVHVLRDLGKAIELVQQWRQTLGEVIRITEQRHPTAGLRRVGLAWYRETPRGLVKVRDVTPAELSSEN